MKRISKTKEWEIARKKLKVEYQERGIITCELRFNGCWRNNALSFAHRHLRIWYYNKPGLLGSFDETILACIPCHKILDEDEELKKRTYERLRK